MKKAKQVRQAKRNRQVKYPATYSMSPWDVDKGFHELIKKVEVIADQQVKVNELMSDEALMNPTAENIRLFHECQSQLLAVISIHEDLLRQFKAFRS